MSTAPPPGPVMERPALGGAFSTPENPSMEFDEAAIRERAYALWQQDGGVHGRADDYWYQAEREIHAASPSSPTAQPTLAPKKAPRRRETTTAPKRRPASNTVTTH